MHVCVKRILGQYGWIESKEVTLGKIRVKWFDGFMVMFVASPHSYCSCLILSPTRNCSCLYWPWLLPTFAHGIVAIVVYYLYTWYCDHGSFMLSLCATTPYYLYTWYCYGCSFSPSFLLVVCLSLHWYCHNHRVLAPTCRTYLFTHLVFLLLTLPAIFCSWVINGMWS
mgnify:CR=1 FL=1